MPTRKFSATRDHLKTEDDDTEQIHDNQIEFPYPAHSFHNAGLIRVQGRGWKVFTAVWKGFEGVCGYSVSVLLTHKVKILDCS